MGDRLDVWYDARRAGSMWQTVDGIEFQYAEEWLAATDAVALSRSLPLSPERFVGRAPTAFFENLLPEGTIRAALAKELGADEDNEFRLLEGIGAECAGALSILPPGIELAVHPAASSLERIDDDALERILTELPLRQLVIGPDGLARFSLAGAQDKLVVVRHDDGGWSLPARGVPSTHIFKIAISGLDDTVTNEGFVMELARRVGLSIANADVIRIGSTEVLCVERYDRHVDATGEIRRLHQEDICQAMGIPSRSKYERDQGPGVTDCVHVIRDVSAVPARDIAAFVRLLVFNALVGNADAHGKNYALLLEPGRTRLAPGYDLISTVVYQHARIDPRLAMRINGKDKIWNIYPADWKTLAAATGMGAGPLQRLVRDMSARLPGAVEELRDAWRDRGEHRPVLDRIVEQVDSACRHVRESWER